MSDLISRETAQAEINKCHITSGVKNQGVWNECVDSISRTIDYIPSADIMECARAIKEYCDKTRCEECKLAEHKVMNDTDNYLCRVHYLRPECWNLPEGEKGGE